MSRNDVSFLAAVIADSCYLKFIPNNLKEKTNIRTDDVAIRRLVKLLN